MALQGLEGCCAVGTAVALVSICGMAPPPPPHGNFFGSAAHWQRGQRGALPGGREEPQGAHVWLRPQVRGDGYDLALGMRWLGCAAR